MITRRSLLKSSLLLTSLLQSDVCKALAAGERAGRFSIGACDWSIGKSSDTGAFDVAGAIGVDGIMVDMGSEQNDLRIGQRAVQEAYRSAAARTGIAVSSLAMGIFNRVPFHSDERVPGWVTKSIDAAANLRVKVLLLAFFNASDLRNEEARKAAAVKHLRALMPYAEAKGITLGIESYLDAKEHMKIMDEVGSDNLKVYFDFRNTADAGYDPVAEFKKLGKDRVCELHMKENGFLLGKGTVNWEKVSEAIYETGYKGNGWMQIEGAMPKGGDIVESYRYNLAYLRERFSK